MKKLYTMAALHGYNDFISGYILASVLTQTHTTTESSLLFFLYNLLAFGGQLPVAAVAEKYFYPKYYLLCSTVLLIFSIAFYTIFILPAIVATGIASAFIHVTGGYEAVDNQQKTKSFGIFAAPGVIGLIGGGVCSAMHIPLVLYLVSGGILLFFILWKLDYQPFIKIRNPENQKNKSVGERHDFIMILLITVLMLRSVIWDAFQYICRAIPGFIAGRTCRCNRKNYRRYLCRQGETCYIHSCVSRYFCSTDYLLQRFFCAVPCWHSSAAILFTCELPVDSPEFPLLTF